MKRTGFKSKSTTKKCKNRECRRIFTPFQPMQEVCGIACAVTLARTRDSKKRALEGLTRRRQHRADKERLKSRADWLREAQASFNRYVRMRDSEKGCCSCDKGKDWQGQWHCSHFYSRGHSSSLRFNLWNCHKSCSVCNLHLSANLIEYTPRLLEKIGQERMDYLYANKVKPAKYSIEYLKRLKTIFNRRCRLLEKRREK